MAFPTITPKGCYIRRCSAHRLPARDGDVSGSVGGGEKGGSVEEPKTTHLSEDSVIVLPAHSATAEVK